MRFTVIICYIFLGIVVLPLNVSAQDSSYIPKKKSRSSGKIGKAADNLKKALSTDDELQIAKGYESLANELIDKKDYSKAEENLNKAKDIYNKLGKEQESAIVLRNLAKVQELQKKIDPAIQNYESAAQQSKDSSIGKANLNDANRLRSTNPQEQQNLAENNAAIFEKQGKKEEAANAYTRIAESQILQRNTGEAVSNLKKAIDISPDPKEIVSLNNKISKVYADDNQLDKAIALSEKILSDAKTSGDIDQQIEQLQLLSKQYQQYGNLQRADTLLNQAYNLSVSSGNTSKAKTTALLLAEFYKAQHKNEAAAAIYQSFLSNLDTILKKDSSLIDVKLFELTEERIKELEKEKTLQVELMQKKTRFNYFLIGSLALMALLLFFIIRALYAIRIKNKKIALQSLRREMNPHFIFNSLNSVNQYIAENNELEANKYLASYSSLMRNVMENSGKDLVSLNVEVDQLKKYLALEHQRFREKFDYTIKIAEDIDTETTLIANMLIQPHLENAIWHGLRYKSTKGTLLLEFRKQHNTIQIVITDDGIGLAQSKLLKTDNQKLHQSRGINNTLERINLLNEIYKINITITMEEIKDNNITGTRVTISSPIIPKK